MHLDDTVRETLKAIATELGISESKAAHIAINQLYYRLHGDADREVSPEAFQAMSLPKEGIVAKRESLLDIIDAGADQTRG